MDLKKTILVVDDEVFILDILQDFLSRKGFVVLTASAGKEAIEVASGVGRGIDLAIVDVKLPDMRGMALAQELHACCPGIRVFLSTGNPGEVELGEKGGLPICGVLEKPFSLMSLLLKIQDAFQ